MSERVVILGPGRMGLALGAALRLTDDIETLIFIGRGLDPPPHPLFEATNPSRAGYLLGPTRIPDGTNILILAVPDSALAEVAHDVEAGGEAPAGCVALHLSGALSSDVLEPLHRAGYAIGSMHPLQSVADPWLAGDRLMGVAFAITGEPAAVRAAHRIVNVLDGHALVIPPNLRALYHAAAVMASNYLVAIAAAGARWLNEAGVPADEALQALLPLMQGTLDNLRHLGVAGALTGPLVRGDADTIRLHLSRLSESDRSLYCALGRETLRIARAAGLDPMKAEEVETLLGART
ncbi:MAG: Rossmann-like and DUF2520 domain-containing protein [Longimicrobiales bacterium]